MPSVPRLGGTIDHLIPVELETLIEGEDNLDLQDDM